MKPGWPENQQVVPVKPRQFHSKSPQAQAWAIFGHECFFCEITLSRSTRTFDHFIPRVRGGQTRGNIVPSCAPCNTKKGGRLPTTEEMRKFRRIWDTAMIQNKKSPAAG